MSLIQYIKSCFPTETPWKLTSSRGISASVTVVGGGIGSLYVNHGNTDDPNNSPDLELDYVIAGASVGPLPAGIEYSTKDYFSMGVGPIFTNKQEPLTFDDMKGTMYSVGLSSSMIGTPDGMAMNIYFMGLPWSSLAWFGYALATNDMTAVAHHVVTHARALGMMIGHFKGVDGGLTSQFGYTRSLPSFFS